MRQLCNTVYVMGVEQLEVAVNVERQVVATLAATSSADLTLPTIEQYRADYDAALLVEPVRMTKADSDRTHLHRALGVAS